MGVVILRLDQDQEPLIEAVKDSRRNPNSKKSRRRKPGADKESPVDTSPVNPNSKRSCRWKRSSDNKSSVNTSLVNPNSKRSRRRKPSSDEKSPAICSPDSVSTQIRMLKRGKKLPSEFVSRCEIDSNGILPVEEEPVIVPIRTIAGLYAGFGFVASPSPSSVPVPGFLHQRGTVH